MIVFNLAGQHAVDCGRSASPEDVFKKSTCATDAFNRKAPFLVQYRSFGTDAVVEKGLALDEHGKLSNVETISSSALYRGKPSGEFSESTCNARSLRKLLDGTLTCDFPPH